MQNDEAPKYLSPQELAARWRCSRSSVDRIARQANLTRVRLGTGSTGLVRFVHHEILEFENARRAVQRDSADTR